MSYISKLNDAGDPGSIPGLGRSPGEVNGNQHAWKIPWTEESDGLQFTGNKRVRHNLVTNTFTSHI